MAFTITKAEALRIQAEQIDHYAAIYGEWIREAVAAKTNAAALADGEHDVVTVNRHIPRGGFIEAIIERHGHKTQVSDKYSD